MLFESLPPSHRKAWQNGLAVFIVQTATLGVLITLPLMSTIDPPLPHLHNRAYVTAVSDTTEMMKTSPPRRETNTYTSGRHKEPHIRVSHPSEGMLLSKVLPVYPRIAVLSGVWGDVKLRAIISKQGTIESLSVTSGHPLLTTAAVDAVRQWKYIPYLLNGEPVEIETYIIVTFRKD